MVSRLRKTANLFDTVILTVRNRPRNLLPLIRSERKHDVHGSEMMCPKCDSNKVIGVIVDESDTQPIIHFVCEACGMEWVE